MAVAPLTLICLSLATLLVAAAPIVLYRWLRRPFALDWRATIAGIAVFALFATVIERALNDYMLRGNSTVAAWLAHPVAFVVYGAVVAGVCEEVGRYIAMRILNRRDVPGDGVPRDSTGIGYGIGHGGAEAWLVGVLVQVQWIALGVLANRGQLDEHLTNLSFNAVMRVHLVLANLSPLLAGVFAVERFAALVFQIGLSVLMWRGVRAGFKGILPVAIAAHALIDLPAAMYQARILPLLIVDGGYAVVAIAVAVVLFRTCCPGRRAAPAA